MILRLFRSMPNFQLIVFFITALLLWADSFVYPQEPFVSSKLAPLYGVLFGWAADFPVAGNMLAFLLLAGQALILNSILTASGVTARNNFLPAFVYVLLFSYYPGLLCMHPVIPGNLMLILGFRMIWKSLHKEEAYQEVLTAALFFALAVFFSIYYLIFMPVIWLALLINRTFAWREWVISAAGISIPLFCGALVTFWNDTFRQTVAQYAEFFASVRLLPAGYDLHPVFWALCGVIVLLSVLVVLRFINALPEKLIMVRRVSQIWVGSFFFSASAFFLIPEHPFVLGSMVLLPVSVFASWCLQMQSFFRMKEAALWLLILGILAGKIFL
jgi:hypothetical protein